MPLQCGIVGLPNVGKSTIFNALTALSVPAENYPFCTLEPHLGIVPLPDPRLAELTKIYQPEEATPAMVEFIDIAGLVRGASRGEGLGNRFLAQIRQVAVIVHVVRCFEDENVAHVEGSVDPVRDAEIVETELLLADLETIQRRHERVARTTKTGIKESHLELELILRLEAHCNQGRMARTFPAGKEEQALIRSLFLLTNKPILYVANVDEDEITREQRQPQVEKLFQYAHDEDNLAVRICGKLEEDIADLEEADKDLFLSEYSLPEPGLDKLIHSGFSLLELETFFTGNPNEVRAWTVPKGTTAWEAAGEIHTDFQRGFIKAVVYRYQDLVRLGSEKAVREAGLALVEGKEYRVQDGDCIYFHFKV